MAYHFLTKGSSNDIINLELFAKRRFNEKDVMDLYREVFYIYGK